MAPIPGVFLRRRFLAADLLDRLEAFLGTAEGERAAVQALPGAMLAVAEDVRRAWEVELPDEWHDRIVARIGSVHAELETFFERRLEPCEAVAALRYPPGSFYRTHRDRAAEPDSDQLHRRAVSIVVFVNTARRPGAAFGGGALRLHEVAGTASGCRDVTPEAGTLVAFPSWQLHEVMPVEWGTRLSLVTWLLGHRE
jgi:predicted 2-oxoglutarate/Fe(II)-dependent dioxygenase YbiX